MEVREGEAGLKGGREGGVRRGRDGTEGLRLEAMSRSIKDGRCFVPPLISLVDIFPLPDKLLHKISVALFCRLP